MVGGVTPGKGGRRTPTRLPIFDTVEKAVQGDRRRRDDDLRPAAVRRRRDHGGRRRRHRVIVGITEGIPVLDMVKVKRALEGSKSQR